VLGLVAGPGTAENAIELVWNALTTATERGGATVLSYEVQWDAGAGTGTYSTLAGYLADFTGTTLTVTSGIQPGAVFSFRVRGKNMWGWGPYSTVLQVAPSAAPDQPVAVVTSVNETTGDLVLTWTAPHDNSATITAYKIEILDKAGTNWNEETEYCNGADAYVMGNRTCSIPMSKLYAAPFSLALADPIYVRVSAYNVNGWSPTSTPSSGATTVRTTPTRMNAPVRDAASSDSQIIVTWTALTAAADTGGAPISSYRLFWDDGSGGTAWYPLLGHTSATLETEFTVTTALVGGQAYLFRLQAENIYGWGPYSTETLIYAAGVPA
jgi:hypothetical protein